MASFQHPSKGIFDYDKGKLEVAWAEWQTLGEYENGEDQRGKDLFFVLLTRQKSSNSDGGPRRQEEALMRREAKKMGELTSLQARSAGRQIDSSPLLPSLHSRRLRSPQPVP